MKKLLLALALSSLAFPAAAQVNRGTLNNSVTITAGGTFQEVLKPNARWSLTIENNNTNGDNCWIHLGSGTASEATSILLAPNGGSYARYSDYVPSDEIQATCATTGDSLYVDTQ